MSFIFYFQKKKKNSVRIKKIGRGERRGGGGGGGGESDETLR